MTPPGDQQQPMEPAASISEQMLRFVKGLGEAEAELGLPAATFSQLLKGPDWALAVYLGALHETALSQALAVSLDRPGLDRFLRLLSVDGRASKVGLAKTLQLINKDQATAIGAFASMRNAFVHDFGMVNQTLHAWLHSQPDARSTLGKLVRSVPVGPAGIEKILAGDAEDLRFALWVVGADLTRVIAAGKTFAAVEAKSRKQWLEFAESIDQEIASEKAAQG